MVDQTTVVDLSRLGDQAGRLSPEQMQTIDDALLTVLGL